MTAIFLNGCTSAGKTSIARALQARLPAPFLRFGIDDAFAMLPLRLHDHPDGFFFDRDARGLVRLNHGPFGTRALRAYRRAAAAIGATVDLIIDEVVLKASITADWIEVLDGRDVFSVGVHCRLAELECREVARGDRLIGQARGQFDVVHGWFRSGCEVDTTAKRADDAADEIIASLVARRGPCRLVALARDCDEGIEAHDRQA